jgi:hypothetical protein
MLPSTLKYLYSIESRWQHGEKVGYSYPSGLEKTLCKWDMYVLLVTKISLYVMKCVYSKVC